MLLHASSGERDWVCTSGYANNTHSRLSEIKSQSIQLSLFQRPAVREPMHNEKGWFIQASPPRPPPFSPGLSLSLDVWLLLWIMNHDPHRLPDDHRWIGGKTAHLCRRCGRAFVLYEGIRLFVLVLCVLLPSVRHVGVRLKQGLSEWWIPLCEQVWPVFGFQLATTTTSKDFS